MKRCIVVCVLMVALIPTVSEAQNNASLAGTVQDSSGGIVPGASVKLTSQGQGTVRTILTNEAGLYQFPFLPAGLYDIEVTMQGFKTLIQRDVTIAVAQSLRRDLTLDLGNISENVTVSANVEAVNTGSAEIGAVIDNTKVVEMPLNGRTFYSLATLTPGVAAPLNNQGFRGAFSVAGACQTCNNFTLNGMDNNDPTVAIPNFRPSIDAIQEFNILTGIYGAQYGLGSGGQIIVSTKSGTNEFHGSAYEFLRNSAMDARNFFSQPGPLPSFKRNLFGGTFGGPVFRNRTFFFYSYEGLRLSQAQTAQTTVPTAAMKRGDFSALLPGRVIRDPLTGQAFPGNIIPGNRLSPIALELMTFYPDPTSPTPAGALPTNNYLFNVPRPERYNQHSVKLDHQFSSRDSMYVTLNYYKNKSVETGTNSTCNNTTLPTFPCDLSIRNQVFGVSQTHIFTPTLVNEARFAYTYTYTPSSARNGRIDFWSKYGVRPLLVSFPDIPDKGVPAVTVTGYNAFASSRTFVRDDPHWQISDTLSWTRNKHTVSMGFNLLHYHTGNTDLSSQGGTLTFTNTSQGPTTGYAMADWLLGFPASTQNTPYRYRNDINLVNIAAFVQDDWKIGPRLTLNLGLRWEVNTPITDSNNRLTNFDAVRGIPIAQENADPKAPLAAPVVGFGRRPYDFDWPGFAPRFGFAWQPFGGGKTVVRGGAGTFFTTYSLNNSLSALFAGFPYQTTYTYTSSLASPVLLSNPFSGSATTTNSLNGAERDFKNARTYQWSLGIQRQVASDMIADVTYFASRTNHMQGTRNINSPAPGPGTPAQVNARRPYPAYGIINIYQWDRNASFHSLQTKLQKRYGNGLSFLATYMFSHNIDNAGTPSDQNDFSTTRGSSTTDVRHRFVASPVWELPLGKGRRFASEGVGSAILGGWQLSALIQAQTGNPQTPTLSGNYSNTASTNDRPDMFSDPNKNAPRTPQKWFNTEAFLPLRRASGQAGATYSFGNAGKGVIQSPGLVTTDLSIVRSFNFGENVRVQFRGEIFNLFNHTNFNFPNVQVDNPNFGTISSAQDPRQIQLALKILF